MDAFGSLTGAGIAVDQLLDFPLDPDDLGFLTSLGLDQRPSGWAPVRKISSPVREPHRDRPGGAGSRGRAQTPAQAPGCPACRAAARLPACPACPPCPPCQTSSRSRRPRRWTGFQRGRCRPGISPPTSSSRARASLHSQTARLRRGWTAWVRPCAQRLTRSASAPGAGVRVALPRSARAFRGAPAGRQRRQGRRAQPQRAAALPAGPQQGGAAAAPPARQGGLPPGPALRTRQPQAAGPLPADGRTVPGARGLGPGA